MSEEDFHASFAAVSPARQEHVQRQRRNKRLKRNIQRWITLGAALLSLFVSLWAVWTYSPVSYALLNGSSILAQGTSTHGGDASSQAPVSASNSAISFDNPVQLSSLHDTQLLQLINREHAVTNMPFREEMSDVYSVVPSINQSIGLHPLALTAVSQLFTAADEANAGPFHVVSGFRDWMAQAMLYEQIADSSLVQPAGHSEHHTGLAIDIVPTLLVQNAGPLSEQLDGNSPEERWLADNSWRFGLILRYPTGTQDITGITFEPWHFRYVGKVHAWYMWQHDMVLEEYLQHLQEGGGFDVTLGERTYHVRYITPESGVVYVPADSDFTLSSDNRGGYIITAHTRAGE